MNTWANEMTSYVDYKIQANLIFKYAYMHGLIEKNPFDRVVTPKKQNTLIYDIEEEDTINFYTKEELKLFLNLLYNEESFKYFDFEEESLRIRKTLAETKGKRLLQTPKSPASRRVISIDQTTLSFLEKWRTLQKEEYEQFNLKVKDDNEQLVFSHYSLQTGEFEFFRLTHLNDKLHHFLMNHPELPYITVHGLRHIHASLLFEAGVTIKDVQARLGCSDIKTTMDIYTHVTNSAREKAAKIFQDFIGF